MVLDSNLETMPSPVQGERGWYVEIYTFPPKTLDYRSVAGGRMEGKENFAH